MWNIFREYFALITVLDFPRYSTGSNLNTYSALIQNFYSQETAPHQAIHVAVNTGVEEGEVAGVRAYIRSVSFEYHFESIIYKFSVQSVHPWVCSPNQRTVYSYLCPWNYASTMQREVDVSTNAMKKKRLEPTLLCITVDLLANTSNSSTSTTPQPIADLEIIERAILSVSDMLDRVLTYVRAVLSGEKKGDPAIGRYLMDTLGASTDDLEKGGFNASLQVSLMRCAVHNFGLISPFLVGAGYVDDFLSCKPCTIASGSVITVGPYHCIMGHGDLIFADIIIVSL